MTNRPDQMIARVIYLIALKLCDTGVIGRLELKEILSNCIHSIGIIAHDSSSVLGLTFFYKWYTAKLVNGVVVVMWFCVINRYDRGKV